MFKLQSPSKYSPFDAIHLSRCFFHCSKQFLNSLILMPFKKAFLPFSVFWIGKESFENSFHSGKKSLLRVRLGEYAGWNIVGMPYLVKHCWTRSTVWAGALINTHHEMSKHAECSKKFTEAKHSLSNSTTWYTDTEGFMKLSPSRGSLYYKGPTSRW